MNLDLSPLFLTFKLALVTTVVLVVIGVPLAYWIAFTRRRIKYFIEPLVSMPLVLPPTVLGFYLLLLFSPRSPLGEILQTYFHVKIVFTFLGLVIGSVLFSLPFMVNPIKAALESFPISLVEASYALGKSERETLLKVILPNIRPSLLTGIMMAFAHTVGEFGVVLMVGGSIPGETRTASIAIFSEVEALNYSSAHVYSGVLVVISFVILFSLNWINRKATKAIV
ncbi:MAG: molybdate ABC transporter permease subunit [Candidatus Omnitrophica bacterium]|nr:molybdate ABC transporter permease subunit [Candidatus Omnitrophota bacterium]